MLSFVFAPVVVLGMKLTTEILFGTFNAHKAEEVQQILGGQYRVLSCLDFPNLEEMDENGATLEANARIKAEGYSRQTGLLCFADDTGLEVEALNGAPGVYSARYAGPRAHAADNTLRLLKDLVGATNRAARFRTVMALAAPHADTLYFEGILEGHINQHPIGGNGFGYDPVFVPHGDTRTLAELSPEAKNAISHRRKAMDKLLEYLRNTITPS
jgi:XTP/dITP diphosphohydrolase